MIEVNQKMPSGNFKIMSKNGPEDLSTDELFSNKKVVLFALPGAFTPTCSKAHLPGYVALYDSFKEKGVDDIVCLSVNDVFVMDAWGKSQNAENIVMAADGSADYTKALGLELDLTAAGMGVRCQRFAAIIDNGVVKHLAIEPPKTFEESKAEVILSHL